MRSIGPAVARDHGFDSWVEKILWRRKWQPLQYSCLENPMDRGAWQATAEEFTKDQTQPSNETAAAAKLLQSCPTLCDPMDHPPPGSSVHGILQARILEWLPFPSPEDLPTQGSNLGLLLCRQILYRVRRSSLLIKRSWCEVASVLNVSTLLATAEQAPAPGWQGIWGKLE